MTNRSPFIKFIRLFHSQSFALYGISCQNVLSSQNLVPCSLTFCNFNPYSLFTFYHSSINMYCSISYILCIVASAICEIKHELHGRDANKARGEASRPHTKCLFSRIAQAEILCVGMFTKSGTQAIHHACAIVYVRT